MISNLIEPLRKPDILDCIANLSSDEVFTPPSIANQVLDLLPAAIWSDPKIKILDPCAKSGVFLREAAKRLMTGLATAIPDEDERRKHIFQNMLYGIAITELTGLISRRSLYYSKDASSKWSVVPFEHLQGNLRYARVEHNYDSKNRCKSCGLPAGVLDRGEHLENYAYHFIHRPLTEVFKMKFDVIVGNPPYQIGSDGGTRDIPVYNRFVDQARALKPKYICMIIPSRWMAGGLGLSDFRKSMLEDRSIRKLVDYERMDEVFPGVDFEGGVCYFLWDRDSVGPCEVTSISGDDVSGPFERDLSEYDVLVRDSRALDILKKVQAKKEPSIIDILSVDKEFGWTSNFEGFRHDQRPGDVALYYNRKGKRLVGWIERIHITKSPHFIDTWKVMLPQAYGERGARPASVLGPSFIAPSPSVCTQTYLFFAVKSEEEAISLTSYLKTRFFRFLVSLRKITQHATRSTYTWVPMLSWDKNWTDAELFERYDLNDEEKAYIEASIREMA